MKRKILSASAKVFLERGYAGTSSKMVADLVGVSNGSPFFHYGNKEGVLLEFVKRMFSGQFRIAERLAGTVTDPLMLYGLETALQMHIVELSEPLRELYVTAYTLSSISAYLYRGTAKRLEGIFGDDLPDAEAKDFYEMEITSTGMMRSFVAVPCDVYFTVERKIARFLECALKICNVPPERRRGRRTIGRVGRYLMTPI